MNVTILIPCLNEQETIGECCKIAQETIAQLGLVGEVLVADNGSDDTSPQIARECGARVISVSKKGYGHALLSGIEAARGKVILMGDADCSYDFRELGTFLHLLNKGNDFVIGSRFSRSGGRIAPNAMPLLHRYFGNPVLSWLGRVLFDADIDDFYCGLRAFKRDKALQLHLCSPGMEFALEMIVKASSYGMQLAQTPITLHPDKRTKLPHLRTWKDGWRSLRFYLLFSPQWLFLYPGIFLMTLGLALLLLLLPGPVIISGVGFDGNSLLLASSLVIIGFQSFLFSLVANSYASAVGFLPPNVFTRRIREGTPCEWGIISGVILNILGVLYVLAALSFWQENSFGSLSYTESLRITVPAATCMSLGTQALFGGFILHLLSLPTRLARTEIQSLPQGF